MVNFVKVKSEKEFALYYIETAKIMCRPFAIFGFIALLLGVCLLVRGCLVDLDMMIDFGCISLGAVLVSISCIRSCVKRSKALFSETFEKMLKDGINEFSISFVDGTYIINNISMGTEWKMKKEDIKKIRKTKKIIIVVSKAKVACSFPNKVEIREMFKKTRS